MFSAFTGMNLIAFFTLISLFLHSNSELNFNLKKDYLVIAILLFLLEFIYFTFWRFRICARISIDFYLKLKVKTETVENLWAIGMEAKTKLSVVYVSMPMNYTHRLHYSISKKSARARSCVCIYLRLLLLSLLLECNFWIF